MSLVLNPIKNDIFFGAKNVIFGFGMDEVDNIRSKSGAKVRIIKE